MRRTGFGDAFSLEREALGMQVKLCRVKAGLTQEALARRVGRRHSYVSRIESAGQMVDVFLLVELLRAMDVEPIDFLERLVF